MPQVTKQLIPLLNTQLYLLDQDKLVRIQPMGHIAFVEQVKSDGSILISESNVKGLGVISYRTFDAETAKQFTYVIGH